MNQNGIVSRLTRHVRLSWRALGYGDVDTPPFFTLYVNSVCNLTCEHCLYWRNLNQPDDLTFEEYEKLSAELGAIENLNLSGGEPFIRKDFDQIVRLYIRNNGVKKIYIPTSGYFTENTERALRSVLEEPGLELFVLEISLDGMPDYHNAFRGNSKSFEKALETYDMLAELQRSDPRIGIHCSSTVNHENAGSVRELSQMLYERCPQMEHHILGMIRGDRKNESLRGPQLAEYRELYAYVRELWRDREEVRFGASVEPMLQATKTRTAERGAQVVGCKAGILSGVVYANGDVSVCETHPPIGNLRQQSFREIWCGEEAVALRQSIRERKCWCTNEIAMWSSIVFQPLELGRAVLRTRSAQKRVSPPASGNGAARVP